MNQAMQNPLAAYLDRHDLTVAEFARQIDEGHEIVRLWSLGRRKPRNEGLRKIERGTAGEVTPGVMLTYFLNAGEQADAPPPSGGQAAEPIAAAGSA
jgi:hypothetical protein